MSERERDCAETVMLVGRRGGLPVFAQWSHRKCQVYEVSNKLKSNVTFSYYPNHLFLVLFCALHSVPDTMTLLRNDTAGKKSSIRGSIKQHERSHSHGDHETILWGPLMIAKGL